MPEQRQKDSKSDDYPLLLSIPACDHIPKEDLAVFHDMWGRTYVVLKYGGPPAGLQMRHSDLERL